MHRFSRSAPRSLALGAGFLWLSTGLLGAQVPRLSVSTTANVAEGASSIGAIDDAALTFVGDGAPIRPHFAAGNWLAAAHFEPADIDGFTRVARLRARERRDSADAAPSGAEPGQPL